MTNEAVRSFEEGHITEKDLQEALEKYSEEIIVASFEETAVEMLAIHKMDWREPYKEKFTKLADQDSTAYPAIEIAIKAFTKRYAEITKTIGSAVYDFETLEPDKNAVYGTIGMLLFSTTREEVPNLLDSMQLIRDIRSGQDFYGLRQELGWLADSYVLPENRDRFSNALDRLKQQLVNEAKANEPHQQYGYKPFRAEGDDLPTTLRKATARLKSFRNYAFDIQQDLEVIKTLVKV